MNRNAHPDASCVFTSPCVFLCHFHPSDGPEGDPQGLW